MFSQLLPDTQQLILKTLQTFPARNSASAVDQSLLRQFFIHRFLNTNDVSEMQTSRQQQHLRELLKTVQETKKWNLEVNQCKVTNSRKVVIGKHDK
jgi:hypothetical protein